MQYRYNHITASGTFDHFHVGHEQFLLSAFAQSARVSIGLSTDTLIQSKHYASQIEPYEIRKKHVFNFLKAHNLDQRTAIFPLTTIRGIALDDKSLEAIVVTRETRANANHINVMRKEKGLPALDLIEVQLKKGTDNSIIRSSRIRSGEIDRQGMRYKQLFQKVSILELPHSLRESLRKPLGIVVKGRDGEENQVAQKAIEHISLIHPTSIISVGDIATQSLIQQGLQPDIMVIDFKTKRNEISATSPKKTNQKSKNPPGTITKSAVHAFHKKLQQFLGAKVKQQLIIEGEEDLLALPAILLAPLGSVVIYGQFDLGLVLVPVTVEIKDVVEKMIEQFK